MAKVSLVEVGARISHSILSSTIDTSCDHHYRTLTSAMATQYMFLLLSLLSHRTYFCETFDTEFCGVLVSNPLWYREYTITISH